MDHAEMVREHYQKIAPRRIELRRRNAYYYEQLEAALRFVIRPGARVLELGCGIGDTLAALKPSRGVGVDLAPAMIDIARGRFPRLEFRVGDAGRLDPEWDEKFDYIVMSNLVCELSDVQTCLEGLRRFCTPRTRILIQSFSRFWELPLKAADKLGLKTPAPPQNWLPLEDMENFLELAGFEKIAHLRHTLVPKKIPLLATAANRYLAWAPLIRLLCLGWLFVARPLGLEPEEENPSLSVVMPCRNERENLSQALERLPVMGRFTELIFVEGGSSDGTAEEAQRLTREYQGPLRVSFLTQDGKGKGDAVRKGFAHARGDILTILDADLTVPPEDLPRFYRALTDNLGEFINGSRLVYPMEDQAMRFLNLLGNKFFGLAFSVFLRQRVRDTLCGTKMLRRTDYELIVQGRSYFGDFDPFGDFDLLFGAAKLGLKIRDMPIRYRERVYGQTNISRFSHGWQLLRMCAFAFRKFAAFD